MVQSPHHPPQLKAMAGLAPGGKAGPPAASTAPPAGAPAGVQATPQPAPKQPQPSVQPQVQETPPPPPLPPVQPGPPPAPRPTLQPTPEQMELSARAQLARREVQIRDLLVRNAIISSPFLREKTILPPGVSLAVFGPRFSVEEQGDELVPVLRLPTGEAIMSAEDPRRFAEPEEALELYVTHHFPERDHILRGGVRGSGAAGNQDGPTPRKVVRSDTRKFSQHLEAIASGAVDVI